MRRRQSAGGSGKRSSSGATSRRPIGVIARAASRRMAPSATARAAGEGRTAETRTAANATINSRVTGEANNQ
jgi:hypothetical protein